MVLFFLRIQLCFFIGVTLFSLVLPAFAIDSNKAPFVKSATQKGAPYSLLEWNPADQIVDRYRFGWEYAIVDGFACGVTAEHQRRAQKGEWTTFSSGLGMAAIQYFDSQALEGPFVRGEFGASLAHLDAPVVGVKGRQLGAFLEGAMGYRITPFPHFSLSASYGARRWLPSFFENEPGTVSRFLDSQQKNWEMHVTLGLGIGFY